MHSDTSPEPQTPPPTAAPTAVAKNEALYAVLGLLIPGLPALLLKDDKVTGGIQLGLWVISWVLAFFLIGFVLWIAVAIWSAIDGYQAAQLWNRLHGFVT
jgi:TM2 domain-containing membrane protein YozV